VKFDVLGVPAILGRTFTPADDVRGGGPDGPVAVISHSFWQHHFGGASDVIGKPLALDRIQFTVIGVTPSAFTGIDHGNSYDVAVPLGAEPLIRGARESAMDQRSWWWLRIIARLKAGDAMEHALVALRTAPDPRGHAPQNSRPRMARYLGGPFSMRRCRRPTISASVSGPLFLIMGVVALVL
jgi:hypothetical protein